MVRSSKKTTKLLLNIEYLNSILAAHKLDDYGFAAAIGIDYTQMWRIRNSSERPGKGDREYGPGPEFIAGVMIAFPKINLRRLLIPVRVGDKKPPDVREVVAATSALKGGRSPEEIKEMLDQILCERGNITDNTLMSFLVERGLKTYQPTDVIPNHRRNKKSSRKSIQGDGDTTSEGARYIATPVPRFRVRLPAATQKEIDEILAARPDVTENSLVSYLLDRGLNTYKPTDVITNPPRQRKDSNSAEQVE